MALVLKDRVKETTSTTGTGTYTLAGAVSGFEAFSEIGNSNTTYYCCTDGTDFEVGIGTYTASGTTLARTTILQSSNSDAAVNWTSGTRTIFCTQPAEKAVSFDASGHINFADSGAPDYENRLRFGAGSDLQIFSDGTHGYFQGSSSNDLIAAFDEVKFLNQAYSKTRLKINSSDAVELYHDNSKKFETTSGGINVTGTVTDDGATHDGDVTFTGDSYNVLWDKSDNALELADNALIKVGDGDDMTIRSDGTYPRVKANNIIFESNNADQAIYFRSNDTGDIVDYDTGTIMYFQQYNDNNEQTTYNRLLSISLDVTDGSEDGRFQFQSLKQGTNTSTFIIDPYYVYLMAEQQLVWYQYNSSFNTNLVPLTPSANRLIRLPDRDGVIQVVDRQVMTSNLAVGWHTIAVFQGRDDSGNADQRFHAKFTLLEYTSSRHQAFTFYAQHMFGQDDGLQVIGNSTFNVDIVTAIRIKSSTDTNKIYAGAAIQVYVANATNNIILYLDEADFDGDESGTTYGNVILKTGVADASDPGDLGYASASYSTFASSVNIGIDSIEPGGIGVTGNLLTQSNIVLEGATADAHETIITATDATADRTITLPDATGTVVLENSSGNVSVTNDLTVTGDLFVNGGTIRAEDGTLDFGDNSGDLWGQVSFYNGQPTGFNSQFSNATRITNLSGSAEQDLYLLDSTASVSSDIFGLATQGVPIFSVTGNAEIKLLHPNGNTSYDYTITPTTPTADRTITLPDATGTILLNVSEDTTPQLGGVLDTNGNNIEFGDSTGAEVERLKFGAGDDLQIYHDGSNSYINDTGTGNLNIRANNLHLADGDGTSFLLGTENSDVKLYHNGSKKLETTADGINVTSTTDAGPVINLISDDPSDATDFGYEGQIGFLAENDASESTLFAAIRQRTADVSDGTENGAIYFGLTTNGTFSDQFAMLDGGFFLIDDNGYIEFNKTRNTNFDVQLYPTTPTADRQIILPDATGTVALTSDLGTIASQAADSVNIDGGAVDGITLGTNSAVTEAQIDNININGNDITSTNSNGAIGITPNGTGDVFLGTDTVLVGDFNSNATITTNGTGDLTLNTNSGTSSGQIIIRDGANADLSITPNGTGSVVIDGLNYPQADGSNGQVLTTNGSGTLSFSTITSGVSNDDATALAIALG